MGLLAGMNYDPSTAATKATSSLLAMTAMDTTNLRVTFTAPSNGAVSVRIRGSVSGATTFPQILLGVLNGSTVVGRLAPVGGISGTAVASTKVVQEVLFSVTGLTGGNNYTWDAAYAVQVILASTALRYGGPNNTTTNDAWGGLQFEVWTAPNLLGSKLYDPSTAVSKSTASLLAMTAIDTTNLRITFTAPASGKVLVRMRGVLHGATTFPQILFGVMRGSTVVGRAAPIAALTATALATTQLACEAQFIVSGLSGSQTWDAAYSVEVAVTSTGLKYGGPNTNAGNNAWGGFLFEVWSI